MAEWVPSLDGRNATRYLAIVEALEGDIASGRLARGARLLPQRELAASLNISVGTVSRAYAEAERRGLISGQVGRGTFVSGVDASPPRQSQASDGMIDLALNAPPSTGETDLIAALLASIAADRASDALMGYLPHQGLPAHRAAIAGWLAAHGLDVGAERVFITHGAQHALSLALSMTVGQGDVVLTECMTYAGMMALSSHAGFRLHGVAMDGEGMVPEALERALDETGSRVVYAMPTLQTPTGITMPRARREAIAGLLRDRDVYLVEDDAYAFLPSPAPLTISALVPKRSFYAMSFAKCLAPGLRIGALVPPDPFRDRCVNALRATGWMAAPVMAEIIGRAIDEGMLDQQVELKRSEARRRQVLAHRILRRWLPAAGRESESFHLWLPLPAGRTLTALIAQAYNVGIRLAAPAEAGQGARAMPGIRLCLGGAADLAELEKALNEIARILASVEEISLV